MEKGCKRINLLEKKVNIIIILFFILICYTIIRLCYINWDNFIDLFENSNGKFDNSIMWSGIGAVLDFFAVLAVIIGLIYNEHSRIKQNKYEFEKEKAIEKQLLFEEIIKNQLENLNPKHILSQIQILNTNNFELVNAELLKYIGNISNIDYDIAWFYNNEITQGEEVKYYIKEYTEFKESITQELLKLIKLDDKFKKIIDNNNKKSPLNNVTEAKRLDNENKKMKNKIHIQKNRTLRNIMHINSERMSKLQEMAKQVVKEREKKVKIALGL